MTLTLTPRAIGAQSDSNTFLENINQPVLKKKIFYNNQSGQCKAINGYFELRLMGPYYIKLWRTEYCKE